MPKKPMVTRTIKETNATVMCVDTITGEVIHKDVVLLRTFKNDKDILKQAKKMIETDNIKVIDVIQTSITEKLYGMLEEYFVHLASEMPPRTTRLNK